MSAKVRKYESTKVSFLFSASKIKASEKRNMYIKDYQRKRKISRYENTLFGGCKETQTNIQKRLKHIDGGRGSRERKEYGANDPFRKKIKNPKFKK